MPFRRPRYVSAPSSLPLSLSLSLPPSLLFVSMCLAREAHQKDAHMSLLPSLELLKVSPRPPSLPPSLPPDFDPKCEVIIDPFNNALMMKKKPSATFRSSLPSSSSSSSLPSSSSSSSSPSSSSSKYIHPTDRHRKPLPSRYTTPSVESSLHAYLSSCSLATTAVRRSLHSLSSQLKEELPTLVTAVHFAVVLQAAAAHVAAAKQKGWVLPKLVSPPQPGMMNQEGGRETNTDPSSSPLPPSLPPSWRLSLPNLTPYWLSRSMGGVSSTVDLHGLFLLTAPNMSGKSTLMRAMAVAALLGNAGLFVPCLVEGEGGREEGVEGGGGGREGGREGGVVIPRFDHLFLRTASFDVPSEGKSAFALEMDDVRVLLRDSSSRSLVFLDELGKGTSAREGAALSGALIEALDAVPVTGKF